MRPQCASDSAGRLKRSNGQLWWGDGDVLAHVRSHCPTCSSTSRIALANGRRLMKRHPPAALGGQCELVKFYWWRDSTPQPVSQHQRDRIPPTDQRGAVHDLE